MQTLITNIRGLVNVREPLTQPLRGAELASLPIITDAYLLIENDTIAGFGRQADCPDFNPAELHHIDASGKFVLPAWCDSHTHLVFPKSRETEFVDKIRGLSYAEIAARGGGILQSARHLESVSEEQLFQESWQRIEEIARLGTGAVEIKSGYGLSLAGELKLLRVIKRLKEKSRLRIRSTFLGAHAFPQEYADNHEGYIDLVLEKMLPAIAEEKLADYIDVFCETGFFSPEQTLRIGEAGKEKGLKVKIHANQLNLSGGVQTGVALGALSVDHLETMDEAAISCLSNSPTIGTILPAAAFFLRMPPPPARALIDANAALAIASDFNPGSAPTGNMTWCWRLPAYNRAFCPKKPSMQQPYRARLPWSSRPGRLNYRREKS